MLDFRPQDAERRPSDRCAGIVEAHPGMFEPVQQAVGVAKEHVTRAGLGTVADVVGLDRNNRNLVADGLRRMRRGAAVAGINDHRRETGSLRQPRQPGHQQPQHQQQTQACRMG